LVPSDEWGQRRAYAPGSAFHDALAVANNAPRSFIWIKTAGEILPSLARLSENFSCELEFTR
jgi:hypothetical protein